MTRDLFSSLPEMDLKRMAIPKLLPDQCRRATHPRISTPTIPKTSTSSEPDLGWVPTVAGAVALGRVVADARVVVDATRVCVVDAVALGGAGVGVVVAGGVTRKSNC